MCNLIDRQIQRVSERHAQEPIVSNVTFPCGAFSDASSNILYFPAVSEAHHTSKVESSPDTRQLGAAALQEMENLQFCLQMNRMYFARHFPRVMGPDWVLTC